jgi:hypothetical protein
MDMNNDLEIDYYDLIKVITLVNARKDVHVEYDKYVNKIFIDHRDDGTVEEVDLSKYKIE